MHTEEKPGETHGGAAGAESPPIISLRDRKLKKVRKIFGVTAQQLAALAQFAPSVVSQVETGRRQLSDETREKICRALGFPDYVWGRPWLFEEVTFVRKATYDALPASVPSGLRDVRPTRTWSADKQDWVRYNAHSTMVSNGLYAFLSMEELQEHERPRPSSEPFSVFEGGAMQLSLLEFFVDSLDRLVIDAHEGEEVYYVMEGNIDLAIMERPPQELAMASGGDDFPLQRKRYFKSDVTGRVKVEAQALDLLREEHPKLKDWLGQFQPVGSPLYEGRFCEVPCEIFSLGPGDIVRVNSKWPHGGFVRGNDTGRNDQDGSRARALFTVTGSYFAETVQEETQGRAKA